MKELKIDLFTQTELEVESIREAIEYLASILEKIPTYDDSTRMALYQSLKEFSRAKDNFVNNFITKNGGPNNIDAIYPKLIQLFPDRGEWALKIYTAMYLSLKDFEFASLSRDQQADLIKSLTVINNQILYANSKGYYHFGYPEHDSKEAIMELYEAIGEGKDLTPEIIEQIHKYEKRIVKINIDVPEDLRIPLLQKLLALKKDLFLKKIDLFRQFKMKSDFNNNTAADFILYIEDDNFDDLLQKRETLITELISILDGFSLPDVSPIPRFSMPATRNGKKIRGLSYTHGNGNFKAYILEKLGTDALNKYYNPQSNWALRAE